jgi:pimeloyl-ACP methyl ester carboxylesterase
MRYSSARIGVVIERDALAHGLSGGDRPWIRRFYRRSALRAAGNDNSVYYEVMTRALRMSESSAPLLILLPGLDGTGKLFAEFLKVLDPAIDTLVIGYPPDVPLGYDELETLVRARLPEDRDFVLLGESFSGPLAIRIAASPPPRLTGLILSVTFARNPYPFAAWARPLAAYLPLKILPRWVRAPLMWGSKDPNRAPSQAQRAMAGVSAEVIRRRITALLGVDETEALRRVRIPVLVLRAAQDRVVSEAATRWILRTSAQAERVDIEGPHLLLQTRCAECSAVIQSFLAKVRASER